MGSNISSILPPQFLLVEITFSLFLKLSILESSSLLIFPGLFTPSKSLPKSENFRTFFGDRIHSVSPRKTVAVRFRLRPTHCSVRFPLYFCGLRKKDITTIRRALLLISRSCLINYPSLIYEAVMRHFSDFLSSYSVTAHTHCIPFF